MKISCLYTILFLVFFSSFSFAQVNIEKSKETIVESGEAFYLHKVEKGHTLYSISRAYNVKIDEILSVNPGLTSSNLALDKTIKIPGKDIIPEPEFIEHTVIAGETLYSLLRKYKTSKDDFFKLNPNLNKNETLAINQILLFPKDGSTEIDDTPKNETSTQHQIDNSTIKKDNEKTINTIEPEEKIVEKIDEEEITETTFNDTEISQPIKIETKDSAKYIYHELLPSETVYALSRKYDVPREQILSANPGIDENHLSIGQIIKIPKFEAFSMSEKQQLIDSLVNINFDISIPKTSTHHDTIFPEIFSISSCDSLKTKVSKSKINIAVLLPIDAKGNLEELNEQYEKQRELKQSVISENMTNFYFGCISALSNFKDLDIEINVNLYDVGRTNLVINSLIENNQLDSIDLIIGPAFRSQIVYLAENRPHTKTPMVLPFTESNTYLQSYENIFLAKTSDFFKVKSMIKHINNNISNNYLIVHDNSDNSNYLADIFINSIDNSKVKIKKLLFDGSELVDIESSMSKEEENVLILTIGGEYRIFRIFTQLFPLKDYYISVIGDDQILNYETIDPKFYLDNNFTYHTSYEVDYKKDNVKAFVEKYRETFQTEPSQLSFWGYDIMNIFISGIAYYDQNLHKCLNNNKIENCLVGEICFSKDNSFMKNSYSNTSTYIYKIQKDYSFLRVFPENKIKNDIHVNDSINNNSQATDY